MTMADIDAELVANLKAAKGKKMFFTFVAKGPGDGKLIVSKKKIAPKEASEAKKALGGGTIYTGKCMGPISDLIFFVAKEAPASVEAAVKKVVKRDAGMTIVPTFKVAGDAESEEAESEAETGAAPEAASSAAVPPAPPPASPSAAPPAAPPSAAGDSKILGIQKALKKLGYDPGALDGVTGPHTQAAIKKFQQASGLAADGIAGPKTQAALAKALQGAGAPPAQDAAANTPPAAPPPPAAAAPPSPPPPGGVPPAAPNLGAWQAARQVAISDLKALAAKVAATKHADAAGVVKEISAVISKLPAAPTPKDIDKLEAFILHDESITAAEASPKHFHDLVIRQPLLDALESLR
jgi:peptidoglycan hydrolase-like protein with peptidoglycan-binding domain